MQATPRDVWLALRGTECGLGLCAGGADARLRAGDGGAPADGAARGARGARAATPPGPLPAVVQPDDARLRDVRAADVGGVVPRRDHRAAAAGRLRRRAAHELLRVERAAGAAVRLPAGDHVQAERRDQAARRPDDARLPAGKAPPASSHTHLGHTLGPPQSSAVFLLTPGHASPRVRRSSAPRTRRCTRRR